jgi:hypothetical protein
MASTNLPVKVTASHLTKLRSQVEKFQARARAIAVKGEAMVQQASDTAVTTATAFTLGMVQGRTGGFEIMGMPLDLIVGAGAHVAGFMKLGGKNSGQLHNVGNGALALYAGTMGRAIGANWKATGKLGFRSAGISGMLPEGMSGADQLSDTDLANSVLHR